MDFVLSFVMVLLSFMVSSVPILLYIWFIWWLDHHDREPLLLIVVAFFWGAVASILISLFVEFFLSIPLLLFPRAFQQSIDYVIFAPPVEELSKSLILFLLLFHKRFNRVLDGLIYGAVVGFGFAASENILYYVSTYFTEGVGIWVMVVILRTLFTTVAHALFTSITGAGVALMKFSRQKWMRFIFPPLALLMAIVLHSLFNLGVVFTELYSLLFFFISVVIFSFSLLVVGVAMFLALHDEASCIRAQLVDELRSGVVTAGEYDIVSSYLSRRRASFRILGDYGYAKYRIASRLFELEIDLAFAKDEMINARSDKARKDALKEVNKLRGMIVNARGRLGEAAALLR